MQQLVIRPRWLVLSAGLVAVLLAVSISTGMAWGQSNDVTGQPRGFRGSGQNPNPNPCAQVGFGGGPQLAGNAINPTNEIATALGMSVAALGQALSSGQTLDQIVAAHHMTSQQVTDAVTEQLRDQLDQQVANGRLTLSQEDAVLASELALVDDVLSGRTALSVPGGQGNGSALGGIGGQQGGRGRLQGCSG